MKTSLIVSLFLAVSAVSATAAAAGGEGRSIRIHLASRDPLAHVAELIRTARAIEHLSGVESVEIVAARGDLEVRIPEDSPVGAPDLVRVVEEEGFHAAETERLANR